MSTEREHPAPTAERGFLDRVFKATIAASIFVAWFLLALGRLREAASFLAGAALGLAMLWSARFVVTRALTPDNPRGHWLTVAVGVLKYGAAGVVVWRITRWPDASLGAFAAGAAMTQIVLLLKALGQAMAPGQPPVSLERLRRLTRLRQ